jgi:hypothetical protein
VNHIENIPFYYDIPDKSDVLKFYRQGIHTYVFVNQSEYDQSEKMEFLQKIMSAAQLIPNDNASIVPVPTNTTIRFSELPKTELIQCVFFGISANTLEYQGNTNLYERIQTLQLHLLFVKSLAEYSNEAHKKLLWMALKEMFL